MLKSNLVWMMKKWLTSDFLLHLRCSWGLWLGLLCCCIAWDSANMASSCLDILFCSDRSWTGTSEYEGEATALSLETESFSWLLYRCRALSGLSLLFGLCDFLLVLPPADGLIRFCLSFDHWNLILRSFNEKSLIS